MENETLHDLNISGIAQVPGGAFNKVKVDGVGKISGDLDCTEFICNGKGSITGNIHVISAEINGTAEIKGSLHSKKLQIHGRATINGNTTAEEVMISGFADVHGDCAAEVFTVHGGFKIDGLLNAGNIDIQLLGRCRVKEMGGENIIVKNGDRFPYLNKIFKPIYHTHLAAGTIEGDYIYLEYTKADVVRGNDVILGPGCVIQQLEYKHQFHNEHGSAVKNHVKM